jgi:hypothetical protein
MVLCSSGNYFGILCVESFLYWSLSWMILWALIKMLSLAMLEMVELCHWFCQIRSSLLQMLSSGVDERGLLECGLSFVSTYLDWNSVHHTETCFLFITCSPYMAISSWQICNAVLIFQCRKLITLLVCTLTQLSSLTGILVWTPCAHV